MKTESFERTEFGTDLSELIGKTLPEAQKACPGMRFIVTESNGKFAEGEPRIIRAALGAERTADGRISEIRAVVSRFRSAEAAAGEESQ